MKYNDYERKRYGFNDAYRNERRDYIDKILYKRYGDYIKTSEMAKELNTTRPNAITWAKKHINNEKAGRGIYKTIDFVLAILDF